MGLQIIRNMSGEEEYVLLPITVYQALRPAIDEQLSTLNIADPDANEEPQTSAYAEPFIKNPITRMRLRAGLKQKDLAELLEVTQAYVSKVENSDKVSARVIARVRSAMQSRAIDRSVITEVEEA